MMTVSTSGHPDRGFEGGSKASFGSKRPGWLGWLVYGFILGIASPIIATGQPPSEDPPESTADTERFATLRKRMVQRHLEERGIVDPRVLEAFRTVPRHRFLKPSQWPMAYEDESLPIGEGQTITPPSAVAFMTEVLRPQPTDRVYEVGTGSGYQASILSRLVAEVYSVEIHAPLGRRAADVLKQLGYDNVQTRIGDGYAGWPEAAPFDAIIVTCAPSKIPPPLVAQLKEGGRMVIPLGSRYIQKIYVLDKVDGRMVGRSIRPTLFVPMTGRAQTTEGQEQGLDPQIKPRTEPMPSPSDPPSESTR